MSRMAGVTSSIPCPAPISRGPQRADRSLPRRPQLGSPDNHLKARGSLSILGGMACSRWRSVAWGDDRQMPSSAMLAFTWLCSHGIRWVCGQWSCGRLLRRAGALSRGSPSLTQHLVSSESLPQGLYSWLPVAGSSLGLTGTPSCGATQGASQMLGTLETSSDQTRLCWGCCPRFCKTGPAWHWRASPQSQLLPRATGASGHVHQGTCVPTPPENPCPSGLCPRTPWAPGTVCGTRAVCVVSHTLPARSPLTRTHHWQ